MADAGGVVEVAQNHDIWFEIGKISASIIVAGLAAWLALIANKHLDKKRANRDHCGLLAEAFREDVKSAVEAGAEYWSGDVKRKFLLEARIKLLESELRAGKVLIGKSKDTKIDDDFDAATQDFLSSLTGSDFEAAKVGENRAQVRELTGKGVALRKLAASVRRSQIS